MICSDASDDYEFHVSARTGANITSVGDHVLNVLDRHRLNPKGYTFYEEPHDTNCASSKAPSPAQ
jgi:hypothetical protein